MCDALGTPYPLPLQAAYRERRMLTAPAQVWLKGEQPTQHALLLLCSAAAPGKQPGKQPGSLLAALRAWPASQSALKGYAPTALQEVAWQEPGKEPGYLLAAPTLTAAAWAVEQVGCEGGRASLMAAVCLQSCVCMRAAAVQCSPACLSAAVLCGLAC